MASLAEPTRTRFRLRMDPIQGVAVALAAGLVAAALLAPLLAPYDPLAQSLLARLRPPVGFARFSAGHLAGTDELGRDVLSRALYGLRLTLGLAFAGAVIGLLIWLFISSFAIIFGAEINAAIEHQTAAISLT